MTDHQRQSFATLIAYSIFCNFHKVLAEQQHKQDLGQDAVQLADSIEQRLGWGIEETIQSRLWRVSEYNNGLHQIDIQSTSA